MMLFGLDSIFERIGSEKVLVASEENEVELPITMTSGCTSYR